ncbi:MAG: toprim domain-containing protein [Sphingobium sp.]
MPDTVADIARKLARDAEQVCRTYLPGGRREGRYWIAGDVHGSKGRSLYVRLKGGDHGKGAAGKWTDASTGEHGDLLDLIGQNLGHNQLSATLDEARRYLALPRTSEQADRDVVRAPAGSRKAAQRLFAASHSIAGTPSEAYLRARMLTNLRTERWLRYHPRCWYRPSEDDAPGIANAFPALIAAVTDDAGTITGAHRTWLDPVHRDKAAVATPRRAMGDLLGHGVRFGNAGTIMAIGEGLETMLSWRMILPAMPVVATLSAAHLAAFEWPACVQRLYVVRDDDAAGIAAWKQLADRADARRVELIPILSPAGNDLNDGLMALGRDRLLFELRHQLRSEEIARYGVSA